jgi:hypothetical protein
MFRPVSLALAAALALAGCDDVAPPPGEVIGTFQFAAVIEGGDAEGRCAFPESPEQLGFDAVLSYEPAPLEDGSRRFWIQILGAAGEPRAGRLTGTRFTTRSPPEPDRVPRSLETCRHDDDGDGLPDRTRCTLGFAEYIEGDLLAQVPARGCTAEALEACGAACRLPAFDPAAGEDLPPVGGVCGEVTEDVSPEPAESPCLCTGGAGEPAPAAPCTIVYRLQGVPS